MFIIQYKDRRGATLYQASDFADERTIRRFLAFMKAKKATVRHRRTNEWVRTVLA